MTRIRLAAVLVAAALAPALSACGLKGDLEPAAPLWGDPNRVATERPLPGNDRTDQVIFTRDDVDLFKDDASGRDPFEARDAEAAEAALEAERASEVPDATSDDGSN